MGFQRFASAAVLLVVVHLMQMVWVEAVVEAAM